MTCPHYTEGVHPDYCVFCREEELRAEIERLQTALRKYEDQQCASCRAYRQIEERAALEPKP
jgi:hypothetical protein